MPTIKFIQHDGTEQVVSAELGISVMRNAVNHDIPTILADCGGSCACATCHVYVDPAWAGKLPPPEEHELAMLDAAMYVEANSRLSCQIKVTPELDGLILRLPISQL